MEPISHFWNPGILSVLLFFITAILSWMYLQSDTFGISDVSNERSMHVGTTKKSGGIWIFLSVFSIALVWFGGFENAEDKILFFFAGLLFFFVIGLADDLLSLGAGIRLFLEIAFLIFFFGFVPVRFVFLGIDLSGIPGASTAVLIVYVLFVVNVCNFMDGLDTYLVSHFLLAVLSFSFLFHSFLPAFYLWICAGLFGFLIFNLPKAHLFMGDAGSLPLGYAIAVLPLLFIHEKNWVQFELTSTFFLLPVFFVDGILTILLRLKDGENILKAHRRHLYQLVAVRTEHKGLVSIAFTLANLPAMFFFGIHREFGIPGSVVFWICLGVYVVAYFVIWNRVRPSKKRS
ncbi:MraY family glycosyltransferase [Leptospira sanjuanensis]|uniref:sugar phosphotransferase n=1 Tax=Leptospira sanjuanensis TaxID=2879643 RepID=UPI001EE7CB8C|nr:sugar phosphotransferase [Leptospira sanjuanensis]MCG6167409.1 sugar phosphotransferase [Leptospira sanjuanensis]